MPTLNTRIDFTIGATLLNDLDLSASAKVALSLAKALVLTSGTGAGQADQLWFDKRTILAAANDDLDLAGGITNGLNQTVTFAKLKLMFIFSVAANLNNLTIGGGSNPLVNWVAAAGDANVVTPGGVLWLFSPGSGYAVTPGTADILRVANPAGSASDYEIVLAGTTV